MTGFFGMEDTIQRVVSYFQHAAQGLEERKQVLYLLGPVGGGKSSLAERLKALMETQPIYVLAAGDELSPVFESPLGLFRPDTMGAMLERQYNIPAAQADRHLLALGGQAARRARRRHLASSPSSSSTRRGCARSASPRPSPATRTTRTSRRWSARSTSASSRHFSQHDPDAYSYSGGLNRTTQGLLEFVEMFKAPIKVLHPLLTATQEGNYAGTENLGALPYQGVILAHSNESEWEQFKNNKNNEAFLDRICVVKVPYCLRATEEAMIYHKLLEGSDLASATCAPEVLEILARFCVLSRMKEHQNSPIYSKMRVYNGDNLKDTDPKAKSIQEYREAAGVSEGMTGISTRFAFKVLSETFNYDNEEIAADPVHLMYVLEQAIKREQYPEGDRGPLSRLHQVAAGAALRRVHRPRDPEGLYRILQRIRAESVQSLYRLRRRVDRGAGLQGRRHRPGVRPQDPRRRIVEDREAGRHRQSEGFPQRDRQIRAARPRQQPGQEPVLDQSTRRSAR